jgi:hypothetical protein
VNDETWGCNGRLRLELEFQGVESESRKVLSDPANSIP